MSVFIKRTSLQVFRYCKSQSISIVDHTKTVIKNLGHVPDEVQEGIQ